eukprot:6371294-Prymnesium_polylepis.1
MGGEWWVVRLEDCAVGAEALARTRARCVCVWGARAPAVRTARDRRASARAACVMCVRVCGGRRRARACGQKGSSSASPTGKAGTACTRPAAACALAA